MTTEQFEKIKTQRKLDYPHSNDGGASFYGVLPNGEIIELSVQDIIKLNRLGI